MQTVMLSVGELSMNASDCRLLKISVSVISLQDSTS